MMPHIKSVSFVLTTTCLICLLAIQSGCSKEEMDKMAEKVKDSASEFSEKSSDAFDKAKATAKDATSTLKEKASELKDKTSETMTNLKDGASGLASSAGNMIAMNGSAEMILDGPTTFPACYLRVVKLNETTNILQLKSNKDGQTNSFPSYLLYATVDGDVDSLNGKTVPCKLFAQESAGGDVWQNATGQTVAVQFTKSAESMTASFSGATLVNTASGSQATSTGKFECVNYE